MFLHYTLSVFKSDYSKKQLSNSCRFTPRLHADCANSSKHTHFSLSRNVCPAVQQQRGYGAIPVLSSKVKGGPTKLQQVTKSKANRDSRQLETGKYCQTVKSVTS